jgi:class 3 adenylate cyclase/tetratricopeptide (TPR) repeat protein
MASELEQLKTGIASLEAQRSALGDVVVDLAVGPLRAKLAALEHSTPSSVDGPQKLKQVTILFLDVVGSTSLSEKLDPEEISAVMDGALARGTAIVSAHRGKVLQYAGDNLLAVFGADEVSEDDTECAVLCGLALLAEGRSLGADVARRYGYAGLNVRVGVHTGGVLLGGGVDAEGTIRGSAVNIAARMEQTAPPGALRISNDTFRQVRGLFEVEEQPPLQVKGLDAPMVTYLVLRAKPRGFRTGTRGIEGVETRMVGREAELQVLKDAYARLHRERSLAFVTVVAEAGVGKSRLLLEFEQWVQGSGEPFSLFQGRADPQTEGRPFGLLRDVVAWHLQIADDDSMAVAKDKIEHGIVPLFIAEEGPELAQSHAHLLGHLIGLDFSDSRYVKGILEDPKQIRARGFHAAAQVFRRLAAADGVPILLQLDDLHWADDGSLGFLLHLARVDRDVPILVIGLTRATLFERASDWSSIDDIHQRVDLSPLDKSHSQMLAGELLKKLPEVPAALSELIMGRAEGNPFYMEELVKMLVDQGALETGVDRWTLHPERLLATRVPATLTGVLQARLDSLPADERLALQQASVIGLVFWDEGLAALDSKAPLALPALERRELALPHKEASLDGMREYAFRHQILHEVTYGTLLKRARRELHGRAAAWLAGVTGARASDFLGVIGEHYEKAGDRALACEFYTRAAEQSRKRYAHEAATGYVERALALIGEDPGDDTLEVRWRLLDVRERTLELQGRRPQQRDDLDLLQQLADALDDDRRRAELATRRSLLAVRTGDFRSQEGAARQAMELAARAQDHELRLNAQRWLADALTRLGDSTKGRELAEKGLAETRVRGLSSLEGRFLNALTIIAARQQDLVAMLDLSRRAVELRRAMGDHRNEAIGLSSLGTGWLELGDLELARRHLEDALRLHRAVGDRALEPIVLANLSQLELWEGNQARAREHALAALDIAEAVQARDLQVLALWSLGNAQLAAEQCAEAAQTFERAQAVARAIDSALQHDAIAGRARVALSIGDFAAALQAIEPLLSCLERDVTLEGTVGTRLIQLTCYQVLSACNDARAGAMLARVHASLQERAATITDPRLRERFLTAVPENREIVAAWKAANQAISEALTP